MNNVNGPFAPARGSQPVGVAAELPPRSEAARSSQPAPPSVIAMIDRRISEAQRDVVHWQQLDNWLRTKLAFREIAVLVQLKEEILGTPELAGPAGNTKVTCSSPESEAATKEKP